MNQFKRISLALAFAALETGMASSADASVVGSGSGSAYAVASTTLTSALVTTSGAAFTFGPALSTSIASAAINGSIQAVFATTDVSPANAPPGGVFRVDNVFNRFGSGPVNYANSDALISRQQFSGDPFSAARDIAEINLVTFGIASAAVGNIFGTTFTVSGTGGVINFSFLADPYLEVATMGSSTASAASIFSITITDSSGSPVFSWSPDGAPSNALGGTDFADPISLNQMLSNGIYSPGPALFGAQTTAALIPGMTYLLTFNMPDIVHASVPELDVIALLGIGLLSLLAAGRRHRS